MGAGIPRGGEDDSIHGLRDFTSCLRLRPVAQVVGWWEMVRARCLLAAIPDRRRQWTQESGGVFHRPDGVRRLHIFVLDDDAARLRDRHPLCRLDVVSTEIES